MEGVVDIIDEYPTRERFPPEVAALFREAAAGVDLPRTRAAVEQLKARMPDHPAVVALARKFR